MRALLTVFLLPVWATAALAQNTDPQAPGSGEIRNPAGEVEAAAADAGGCAPAAAMEAEQAALEQANERYSQGLISISDRDAVQSESVGRIEAALDGSAIDRECARTALELANDFYDEGIISITSRDAFSEQLVEPLADGCAQATSADGHVDCLAFVNDAYNAGIISISTRDDLRSETFGRLVTLYKQDMSTDEALTEVNELYGAGLISITERDGAREQLLNAEQQ